jgi:predicted DCC family thiol-disulfide oxidoreductase YuxK
VSVQVVRFTVAGVPRDAGDPVAGTSAGASGMNEGRPYTVVYDGHCKVCGRMVRALRRWDANSRLLEIVPSQLPGLDARFPWIPAAAYLESVQLVGPGGTTWQGAAAIERLLDVLPRGGLLGWVFSVPFVRALADRFYRWFARNRYRLGCGEHCALKPA